MAVCNIGIMDGGHVIIGSTEGYGSVGDDLWMFKVDNTGSVAWNKHYGGAGNAAIPVANAELIPLWMIGAIVAVIIFVLVVVIVLLKRKPKKTQQP